MEEGKPKRFFKQHWIKFLIAFICLTLGGFSTNASLAGAISTLLYIAAIALVIDLVMKWRGFEKEV